VTPPFFEMYHCTWRAIGQYEWRKFSEAKQGRVLPFGQSPTIRNGGHEEDLYVCLIQM